jgi:hypothetical protein
MLSAISRNLGDRQALNQNLRRLDLEQPHEGRVVLLLERRLGAAGRRLIRNYLK